MSSSCIYIITKNVNYNTNVVTVVKKEMKARLVKLLFFPITWMNFDTVQLYSMKLTVKSG